MLSSTYQWYAMRATYKRELIARDYLTSKGFEVFVPMKKVIKVVRGIKRKISVPAINSLIFVYAQKEQIQQAKLGVEYLQYVTKKVGVRNVPIIVPDRQMEQFIKIVQDDAIEKTFLVPEEVDLSLGTRVKIHGGNFDGMVGVLAKIKGKRNKQFYVNLDDLVTVNIAADNLHLLEVVE